jgi:hypothetical protein
VIVQYWRSFDHLEAFARDESDPHTATWREYYRRASRHQGAGIWHGTYLVRAGEYEAIYVNMPASGLRGSRSSRTGRHVEHSVPRVSPHPAGRQLAGKSDHILLEVSLPGQNQTRISRGSAIRSRDVFILNG